MADVGEAANIAAVIEQFTQGLARETGKPVIATTGMATIEEIQQAADIDVTRVRGFDGFYLDSAHGCVVNECPGQAGGQCV